MIKFEREIEVRHSVDVFIAGGGPSGVAAAVSAARCGLSVYLAEKGECFGGMGTLAKVPAFMCFSDGVNFLSGGIGREIFDKLYGKEADFTQKQFSINTEKLKKIYDEMMLACGAKFSFETNLIDIECQDGEIKYAVLKGKEKLFAVTAKWFIDATGDGFIAVNSGNDAYIGDNRGHMMPGTLCSYWGDIDWERVVIDVGKDPDSRCLGEAFKKNMFTVKDGSLPGIWRDATHYGGGNVGHAFGVDGTDENSITAAVIDARKRMAEYQTYYNTYIDGYENARLLLTADCIGIRETRHIICDYMAKNDDYFNHKVFEDEIGRYCYPMDVHSHNANGDNNSDVASIYQKGYETGMSYGISYKSLIPKKTKNLLVSGRCIGAEREIAGSMRVMPCCYITGMAAGVAVWAAKSQQTDLRNIDVKQMQKKLKEMGAFLPNCD